MYVSIKFYVTTSRMAYGHEVLGKCKACKIDCLTSVLIALRYEL